MRRKKSGKDADKQATVEENPANLTKKRKGNWRRKAQIEAIENKRSASSSQEEEELAAQVKEGESSFFGCYLLTSLSPRFKGCTYIGFTVNPRRRIRQHNGEITSGAWRTKNKRPWEMVLCIYGFPTNVSALQFEWAWQHPKESLAVREAAVSFKAFGGVANKIKMAYTMLTLPAWQRLNLTVNFFSTKYTKHTAGCPTLPEHMKVRVCPMDDLPCYSGISYDEYDDEECDGISGSQELADEGSVESHNSSAGIEESIIEQNTTGNLTEQMISKKHKWDQKTTSPKENHRHSSFTNFPWASSPFGVRSNNILDSREDELRFEDSDFSFHHQTNKSPETIVISSDQRPSHRTSEVEIIDICTPPPLIDKRTLSTAFPEIIDLTESPIFI
ncbi:PREDICTED: uncharacterized protein LOC109156420 [Ipomoea nil]|uniref:uncharacterized protein LOC109156420 n=1 Tax=Ipomoea nil TaxID=35883 RepID=UPI00090173BD|nr:PREDICTED: uncharacterized protein LOC109156420 [Ipomoea nil]